MKNLVILIFVILVLISLVIPVFAQNPCQIAIRDALKSVYEKEPENIKGLLSESKFISLHEGDVLDHVQAQKVANVKVLSPSARKAVDEFDKRYPPFSEDGKIRVDGDKGEIIYLTPEELVSRRGKLKAGEKLLVTKLNVKDDFIKNKIDNIITKLGIKVTDSFKDLKGVLPNYEGAKSVEDAFFESIRAYEKGLGSHYVVGENGLLSSLISQNPEIKNNKGRFAETGIVYRGMGLGLDDLHNVMYSEGLTLKKGLGSQQIDFTTSAELAMHYAGIKLKPGYFPVIIEAKFDPGQLGKTMVRGTPETQGPIQGDVFKSTVDVGPESISRAWVLDPAKIEPVKDEKGNVIGINAKEGAWKLVFEAKPKEVKTETVKTQK